MKYRTPYNYEPHQGFVHTELSLTKPDDTMSLRTILDRHARGIPITGTREQMLPYEEEHTYTHPKALDLSEIEDMSIEYKGKLKDAKNYQKQVSKAATEKQIRDMVKKEQEAAAAASPAPQP